MLAAYGYSTGNNVLYSCCRKEFLCLFYSILFIVIFRRMESAFEFIYLFLKMVTIFIAQRELYSIRDIY